MKLFTKDSHSNLRQNILRQGALLVGCLLFLVFSNGCDISPVPTPIPGEQEPTSLGGYEEEGEYYGDPGSDDYEEQNIGSQIGSEPNNSAVPDPFDDEGELDEGTAEEPSDEIEESAGGAAGGAEEGGEASDEGGEEGVNVTEDDTTAPPTDSEDTEEEEEENDGCGSQEDGLLFEDFDAGSLEEETDAGC